MEGLTRTEKEGGDGDQGSYVDARRAVLAAAYDVVTCRN